VSRLRRRAPRTQLARREKFSREAIRQQQLAWYLYITEGHLANLRHARAVNNFDLYTADVEVIDRLIKSTAAHVDEMRNVFFPE
jgi:hypothetical protein